MEPLSRGRLWNLARIVLSIYLLHLLSVRGKYLEGHLKTSDKWHFLARFCFLSNAGRLEFEFTYPLKNSPQSILLYFDEPHQWDAVYQTQKNCYQKEAVLRPENNQIINLTTRYTWSGCKVHNTTGTAMLHCQGGRSFRSARERWWFIAVSNCEARDGLDLQYKMRMTNGKDLFHKEFSADEFYILQVDIAFLLAFLVIFLLSVYVAFVLRGRQLFHTTYKLYMASLGLECVYLFFMCVAYGKYANDGKNNRGLLVFARIFESASTLVFLLMLILMAKGYTITRGRISQGGAIKIAIFMTLFVITYIILFFYEAVFFDPGLVLYLYESPPGYGLIALRILGWMWFCYAIFFTLKHYPEKSPFYYPFFCIYTLWFWSVLVVIFIAMAAMNKWVREKVVTNVVTFCVFVGQLIFLVLTRPAAANKNFPYHVRTSQIGVMNSGPAMNGANGVPYSASNELNSFTPYPYAVSEPPPDYNSVNNQQRNFSEMFIVSNQRSTQQANLDKFPHQKPGGDNPFIVTK